MVIACSPDTTSISETPVQLLFPHIVPITEQDDSCLPVEVLSSFDIAQQIPDFSQFGVRGLRTRSSLASYISLFLAIPGSSGNSSLEYLERQNLKIMNWGLKPQDDSFLNSFTWIVEDSTEPDYWRDELRFELSAVVEHSLAYEEVIEEHEIPLRTSLLGLIEED